jgi:glycosyltransferase involved in cell wall biosynthesis
MTMSQPLVTVIVPVYNGERYLAFALRSIFEQDYRPLEIIVVDDGSVDGSADIAKSFPEIRYSHQSNQGVAVARNVGLDAAQGEFIGFLDQDDLWMPNKLSRQIDYLLKYPEVDGVLTRSRLFLEPGIEAPSWLKRDLLLEDQAGYFPSALVVRKTAFEQVGRFDPAYRTSSDSDWFFRAKNRGVSIAILPETCVHRRIHKGNHSYQAQLACSELLKVVKSSIDHQRSRGPNSNRRLSTKPREL